MKNISSVFFLFLIAGALQAQPFTRADTLRGSNGPARDWWDVTHYDLSVRFNLKDSTISGVNIISFRFTAAMGNLMQIDLQHPLKIDSAILDLGYRHRHFGDRTQSVPHRRKVPVFYEDGSWFARLDSASRDDMRRPLRGPEDSTAFQPNVTVYFSGKPKAAVRPPWDGGLVWGRDQSNRPLIGVACQGIGASIWFPCKDYQGDEPDSATMRFTAPDSLMIVSNGRMQDSAREANGMHTITWSVKNPINSYNISPNIGKYVHFGDVYEGESGPLTMDYWVIDSNLAKAKNQFKQAPMMMEAFEYWFGPYPFYDDGYKLVETPYVGMEHQSAVAYGNHYENGYNGRDPSGSGWGMKWDFILVHESGHEWFGNNITTRDIADMWVHEGFTNYSEALFTEYHFGKQAGSEYVIGSRRNIRNDRPVIGHRDVHHTGSGDMYYKAGNMIHMIRQLINDDEKFRIILRGLNKEFRHQVVTGRQVQQYINEKAKMDFDCVFKQYLETTQIPVLEYRTEEDKLIFRWANTVDGFNMPVRVLNDKEEWVWIHPSDVFQATRGISKMQLDQNFYADTKEVQAEK